MTPEPASAVPQPLAEQFAKAFADFVAAVRNAIAQGIPDPAIADRPAFLIWQTQALPRLEEANQKVQHAWALYLIGDTQAIVGQADEKRHISRELDGYALDFSGAENAKTLDRLETAVAVAAYRVCAAAGVP